ncbi:hypothetical protein D9M68_786180 [compost metagenome]
MTSMEKKLVSSARGIEAIRAAKSYSFASILISEAPDTVAAKKKETANRIFPIINSLEGGCRVIVGGSSDGRLVLCASASPSAAIASPTVVSRMLTGDLLSSLVMLLLNGILLFIKMVVVVEAVLKLNILRLK